MPHRDYSVPPAGMLTAVSSYCSSNAGIQFVSPVQDFPEDKWDDIIAVCLNSTFHATKAVVPHMLANGWGRIINTGTSRRCA